MQIVRLSGGLGNQMFQAAYAYALSKKLNTEAMIDISHYYKEQNNPNLTPRYYLLNHYNIPLKLATEEQLEKCLDEKYVLPNIFIRLKRFLLKQQIPDVISNVVKEKHAGVFEPDLIQQRDNAVFIGYYQTEKYFKDYREDIINMFSLKDELNEKNQELLKEIQSKNSISLHVRRGDYLKLQQIHGLCTPKYYNNAMKYMAERVENPHFFLFSDDTKWVKQFLYMDYPFTVVDINNTDRGYFDLELMRNCKHHIVANSTFSWWGAWLSTNPTKIVVAPEKWFTDPTMPYDDVVPAEWIKMS